MENARIFNILAKLAQINTELGTAIANILAGDEEAARKAMYDYIESQKEFMAKIKEAYDESSK